MKIMANKTSRYVELIGKSELTISEQKECASLKRMLTARGLDPKHTCGLIDRALIFDNMSLVQNYIETAKRVEHADRASDDTQRALDNMIAQLRKLGIGNINRRSLQTVVNELKKNAKAADRLKRTKTTRPPHRSAPEEEYADDEETEEEDDVTAEAYKVTAV